MNVEDVREALDYDPKTGVFRWRTDARNRRVNGVAGTRTKEGYVQLNIKKRAVAAHRVAWLLMYGSWPSSQIDHINGDKADNRKSNLRAATHSENMRNRRAYRNNASGLKGVTKCGAKWRARIMRDGKSFCLGLYESAEDANDAYAAAAAKLHEEFARAD